MSRPDRHRAELVAAAGRLLRRQGYSGTSVSDLLQAAGAANGSLYHHFPRGKADLARAAIDAAADHVEVILHQTFDAADDVVAATQSWIDTMIENLELDPRDGCPVAPTAMDTAGTSELLRVAAAAAFERWSRVLEQALARSHDPDTAAAHASVLLSAIEGALLLDRTAHSTTHLRAVRNALPALLAPEDHRHH